MSKSDHLSRRRLLAASAGSGLLAASSRRGMSATTPALSNEPAKELALEPGWLLRWEGEEPVLERDKHVLVRDGRIEAVQNTRLPASIPRLEMENCLLMPGFISGHTHVCSGTPTRGIIEKPNRGDVRPLELVDALLDDAELDALTEFNLAEMVLSGCTTQVEMSCTLRQAESYARVAKRFGVRGYLGTMIPKVTRVMPIMASSSDTALEDAEPETLAEIEQYVEFALRNQGVADGRLQPMTALLGCQAQTPATMQALAEAAQRLGNGIHIHLAYTENENDLMRSRWGRTSAQWCEDFGFFDGPVFAAHFAYGDWEVDAPILLRHGAIYSHCPAVGGAGGPAQPYAEALGHDLKVNIGIDTHANDYIENLKQGVIVGQARYHALKDHTDLPMREPIIEDAVRGSTLYAADALRRPDLGRIAEGAQADLIAIDVSGYFVGSGTLPPEPLSHLLHANGTQVRHVMTAGIVQVRDSRLEVADSGAIMKRGGAATQRIWAALEDEGFFAAP